MEDRIIENNKSAKSSGRQEYADSLFHALVACYVNDLKNGLENFTSINHVKNLGRFKALLEEFGHSIAEAHQLAIVERRLLRKERTKARNEKIKTDRIAAREERRRMKAEREQKEGWATEPIPEGMFIFSHVITLPIHESSVQTNYLFRNRLTSARIRDFTSSQLREDNIIGIGSCSASSKYVRLFSVVKS